MNDHQWDIITQTGLQFFGKMSASISHEIKNALAIINESAGLLSDLSDISISKGMPLSPEKNKSIADKMTNQIKRANDIVKSMNQLAHSPDEAVNQINLCDLVKLIIRLSHRFASMKVVTLNLICSDNSISVTTNPFLLEALIFHCLECSMASLEKGAQLDISLEKKQQEAMVSFKPFEIKNLSSDFPSEKENALIKMLNTTLTINNDEKSIILNIPIDYQ